MASEFDLIRTHFADLGAHRGDVLLGVGDDCALLRMDADRELAVSIDTLVAGVHFVPDCDPCDLGHKALAVGLSDLAAMGAEPLWATLALTLPAADPSWLAGFCRGFGALATAQGVRLVGGDTTRGPLTISVQVHGSVPTGAAVQRKGARSGDLVCVTGTLGDAGLALRLALDGESLPEALRLRLDRPEPRVGAGLALRDLASAMIDVSDGLVADLGHVLAASGVGAEIDLAALPLSPAVAQARDWALPLCSGDDYELCFTLPPDRQGALSRRPLGCRWTAIGRITDSPDLICRLPDGASWRSEHGGYDHFGNQTGGESGP